jgi:collagenase-like PrtC family protease
VYSGAALDELAAAGAVRWVPPVELPVDATGAAIRSRAVEAEMFAFGRLPLALSARCFTARHYGLNRDECAFRCLEHPPTMPGCPRRSKTSAISFADANTTRTEREIAAGLRSPPVAIRQSIQSRLSP